MRGDPPTGESPTGLGERVQQLEQELRASLEERARLQEEMREAERRSDEFLAMLGHELRNPLAPIFNALELMKRRQGGGQREQEMLERQMRHLARLVDDLLDIARIRQGKVELKKEPVELGSVLTKSVELARPVHDQRAIALSVEVPRQALMVEADPVRLAQVLDNLLTNAAKYTDPGGRVAVTAGRDGGEVVCSIADNGIGISSDTLPRIFGLFVQADRALDHAQGGMGIGLSLARRLVELHGGAISARSAGLGHGSEFTVRLPAYAPPAVAAAPGTPPPPDGSGPAPAPRPRPAQRILVVDDNVDAAASLGELLQELGHLVAVAHDGGNALTIASRFEPDTALVDIGLPVMDGYEVARKLRALFPARPLRLIAVTGFGRDGDREKSLHSGFDLHLVKPVDLEALATLVAGSAPG